MDICGRVIQIFQAAGKQKSYKKYIVGHFYIELGESSLSVACHHTKAGHSVKWGYILTESTDKVERHFVYDRCWLNHHSFKRKSRCDWSVTTAATTTLGGRNTYSLVEVLSPPTSPACSEQPADSVGFFRLEYETFLRLVALSNGVGSSSSSLLVSFNQAGTDRVDRSRKTLPELRGLGSAPFVSDESGTPDFGRPTLRALKPLRGLTLVLVVGVWSAAFCSSDSSHLFSSSFWPLFDSICIYLFRLTCDPPQTQGLIVIWREVEELWYKNALIVRGLYRTVTYFTQCVGFVANIIHTILLIYKLKLFLIIYSIINRYHFKEADAIFAFLKL